MAWQGTVDLSRLGTVWYGEVRPGEARLGVVGRCEVRLGLVRFGVVRHG